MKTAVFFFLSLISIDALAGSGAVRLKLKGEVRDDTVIGTFDGTIFIPTGESREVFAAPYTLELKPEKQTSGDYKMTVDIYGLGPEYRNLKYDFDIALGERMLIPDLPAKNKATAYYSMTILDDTSSIRGPVGDMSDTTKWGMSNSIHYLTRWQKSSLADFTWNTKMGYLENIYDQYRYSYKLSIFEKIELTFYPEPTESVYMDTDRNYAILPGAKRIDLVYGHDIDAASPAPAAELLIYRLWGYGPRWMVVGMAHYYEDNFLKLRRFADKLDPSSIERNMPFDSWADSDTGIVFCGGFVNWLITNYSQSSFTRLYRDSSPTDFKPKFKEIYGVGFEKAIRGFLDYAKKYKPEEGELDYYASIYLRHNDFSSAADLYGELATEDNDKNEEALVNLAACRFWAGDYKASGEIYTKLLDLFGKNPRYMMLKADALLALGNTDQAIKLYRESFTKFKYDDAGLRLVGILIDRGKIDSAWTIFRSLGGEITKRYDYSMEKARLEMAGNNPADDSLLEQTATRALSSATETPDDPRGYMVAGKAFALMGDYDKAAHYLNIAFFLERRPYSLASTLMELGKIEDLRGNREKAVEYYGKASQSGGGGYINGLCAKYIENPYKP